MDKKAKLLFLIPSLRGGGAERVAVNLIPFLAKYFNLTLVLLEGKVEYELPEVDFNLIFISKELNSIKGHLINTPFHIARFYRLVKSLSPDIVLSFMEQANILNLLISKLLRYKAIISQRIDPACQYKINKNSGKKFLSPLIVKAAKSLYPISDKILCVSNGVRYSTVEFYKIPISKTAVIPNPVNINKIKKTIRDFEVDFRQFFLVPGRLNILHKGQDIAIKSFAKLIKTFPKLKLALVGEGPDLDVLKRLVSSLGISDNVLFLGWRNDIWGLMSKSISTILPSRYEGWPNVLVEAMAAGSPVIAADCPHGPKEILDGGRFGMLVPMEDEDALLDAMSKMLSEDTRSYYKKLGEKRAREFDINLIGMKYVDEILRVLKE